MTAARAMRALRMTMAIATVSVAVPIAFMASLLQTAAEGLAEIAGWLRDC